VTRLSGCPTNRLSGCGDTWIMRVGNASSGICQCPGVSDTGLDQKSVWAQDQLTLYLVKGSNCCSGRIILETSYPIRLAWVTSCLLMVAKYSLIGSI